MGQPKKLSPDVLKLSGRYPAGVLENPKPIAQRFAHSAELRPAAMRPADPPKAPLRAEPPIAHPSGASAGGRPALPTRLLIAGLLIAALVPSLILGFQWLGLSSGRPSQAVPPSEAPAVAPSAVLTASAKIQAVAGEPINFPIALDGTDAVPPRSVIAIKGLPQGSNLSEGRPFGESEWTLKPDQIGDLRLVLPASANGEFKLGMALIAPDDKVIAAAETLLDIAPAPQPAAPAAIEESSVALTDGTQGAAPQSVPESVEGAGPAPAAEAGLGDGAAEIKPAEAAAIPADTVQQTTAPSGEAQPSTVGQAEDDASGLGTVQPSVFVNLREEPSSSAPVLGVIAKGAELSVLDRKRGWVRVTDPKSGKTGWIYSGLLAGEAPPDHRGMRVAPAEPAPKRDPLWRRLGRWLNPWSNGS